ncbi:uncharacterized protein LOC143233775 isoform X2 [Tachypleus tridentatus]|uniref:uncharacterized protein LOC143233775 isoform X2 n=1 Tax=Tachypleus tridentatus TaxID=6853 RepID=UPI003FD612B7
MAFDEHSRFTSSTSDNQEPANSNDTLGYKDRNGPEASSCKRTNLILVSLEPTLLELRSHTRSTRTTTVTATVMQDYIDQRSQVKNSLGPATEYSTKIVDQKYPGPSRSGRRQRRAQRQTTKSRESYLPKKTEERTEEPKKSPRTARSGSLEKNPQRESSSSPNSQHTKRTFQLDSVLKTQ